MHLIERAHRAVALGDVAQLCDRRAERAYGLDQRIEHDRVRAHPEIVVRAPHRHLGADAVIERAGKQAATPLEMGEGAVAPFRAKRIKTLFEEAFVIHLVASLFAADVNRAGAAKLGAVWAWVFPGPAVAFTSFPA